MDKKKFFKTEDQKKREVLFLSISILFGLCFFLSRIGNDDVANYNKYQMPFTESAAWILRGFTNWSSRMFINLVMMIVSRYGRPGLMIYSGISMYIALKAIYLLGGKKGDFTMSLFISSLVMTYPFLVLSSSGWSMATASYFGPTACMLMALVPIRKAFDKEKIPFWQDILYFLAILYGANSEQNALVLLGCYTVAVIFFAIKKRFSVRVFILWALAVGSMIFILTCPGNWSRHANESKNWFPSFGMLDTIDKLDLGVSTTLQWLFCEGQLIVFLCCLFMMILIWKKYTELLFRVVSAIPVLAIALFGPLRPVIDILAPMLSILYSPVNQYGAFNVETQARGVGPLQFCVLLFIAVCVLIEVFLINDTVEGCVFDLSIIVTGVGSRVMMGLSPTIHASMKRTCTALFFCLCVVTVHTYSTYVKNFKKEGKKDIMPYLSCGLLIYGFLNLASTLVSVFY